jgi:predicted transcriptional regulator
MPKPKFTDTKLKQLVNDGLNCTEIAKRLGVTKGAVSQRLKALNLAASKEVALVRAGEVVRKELNTVAQLQKINDNANELLDLLMTCINGDEVAKAEAAAKLGAAGPGSKDPKELALKCMQEIRSQLKLQLEIFQALYDIQAVAEFQKEVLEAIGNAAPETRDRIIYHLKEKRAIRSTLEFHRA